VLLGGYYRYDEELIIPIIENTPFEEDLQVNNIFISTIFSFVYLKLNNRKKERMANAMNDYPDTCAVLVRRHGIYVWGPTWQSAKSMCECYDYLCEIAVRMKSIGLDPVQKPSIPPNAYV
jgi:methylthioribulose-1-phosphate dehydratase